MKYKSGGDMIINLFKNYHKKLNYEERELLLYFLSHTKRIIMSTEDDFLKIKIGLFKVKISYLISGKKIILSISDLFEFLNIELNKNTRISFLMKRKNILNNLYGILFHAKYRDKISLKVKKE